MRLWLVVLLLVSTQSDASPQLRALAAAERAFAHAATVKGIRDAFIEFFAEDALALVPEPTSYQARLRSRPSVPFSENELRWEPRLGDIAASGELGWLTGPSIFINHKDKQPPRHGNYLSVWRQQANGAWRVLLDVGSTSPRPVPFADGFKRFPFGPRYSGQRDKPASTASLLETDRALNTRLTAQSTGQAYAPDLATGARLHRDGMAAVVGRDAVAKWLDANAAFGAVTGNGESAASGDFGYTYGVYQKNDAPDRGSYIRLWSRTPEGKWLIVVDVMNPAPPR